MLAIASTPFTQSSSASAPNDGSGTACFRRRTTARPSARMAVRGPRPPCAHRTSAGGVADNNAECPDPPRPRTPARSYLRAIGWVSHSAQGGSQWPCSIRSRRRRWCSEPVIRCSTKHSSRRWRSSPATAGARWSPTALISASSSSGSTQSAYCRCRQRGPHRAVPGVDGRTRAGPGDDRPSAVDGVRLLPLRPHRWPHHREPGTVRAPTPRPPAPAAGHGSRRVGVVPVHRRAEIADARRAGGAARLERPPGQ